MRILVVRKMTNFELHGARTEKQVEAGFLGPENLSRLRTAHDQHYRCIEDVRRILSELSLDWTEITRNESWPVDEFDCIISIGGDGTLLSVSQASLHPIQVIGVRSSASSVGYLCQFDFRELGKLRQTMAEVKWTTKRVERMQAEVARAEKSDEYLTVPVLNEFLFANTRPAATTRYRITVNDEAEFHKSSGIWVSTATGSTAAIYAAGGQKLAVTDDRFQYQVRELYNSQNLPLKHLGGCFRPEETRIVIENRNENALLAFDGQHGEVKLSFGDRISFVRAEPLLLVQQEAGEA
ncbi:NAD(+)/NADH kinase [Oligoflexaceae bacterium]|nr:NAD(+)/NADH kinase [Oligoflexaceae bacterium]